MNVSLEKPNLKYCVFEKEIRKFEKIENVEDESTDCLSLEKVASFISDKNPAILRITVIDLPNCNLESLPTSFGSLPLKTLILSKNQFTMIPVCLYNGLENLEVLDLSENLIEQIDIAPDCCTSLRTLKLNKNKFKNPPKWILESRCTNLVELDYSFNMSRSYKSSKLRKLTETRLEKLHLRNCCLLSEDFHFFKSINSLKYLDLSNYSNYSKSILLNEFTNLDELFVKPLWEAMEVLVLNNLTLSFFPEGIMWIESLRELYLTFNCLTWIPDGIEYLINLEILDLRDNEISVSIPQIEQLHKLKILLLGNNRLSSIPNLDELINLQTLDLYNNYLMDFEFDVTKLHQIDLECNYFATSDLIAVSEYKTRMLAFRADTDNNNMRYCGPKEQSLKLSESRSSTTDDFEDDRQELTEIFEYPEENWDDLEPIRATNTAEITPSDDEWQGITSNPTHSSRQLKKVYIDEEEWWFMDAD